MGLKNQITFCIYNNVVTERLCDINMRVPFQGCTEIYFMNCMTFSRETYYVKRINQEESIDIVEVNQK